MDERLDKILIQRKLVDTRSLAEKIIREDGVKVNGKLITKAGKKFPSDADIELVGAEIEWISRDALKLEEALKVWSPKIAHQIFLDIGAAAGGFTEVLLSNKAKKVYSVESKQGLLHPKLVDNPKCINLEKTHVRELTPKLISDPIDGCVLDVSDISLENIFPFIHPFIKPNGDVIVLVKPQFEVGKKELNKEGVVKDKKLFTGILEKIKKCAELNHFKYEAHISSPILGRSGNQEFLMKLKKCAV